MTITYQKIRSPEEKALIKAERQKRKEKKNRTKQKEYSFENAINNSWFFHEIQEKELAISLYKNMIKPLAGKRQKKMLSNPHAYLAAIAIACEYNQYLLKEPGDWQPQESKAENIPWEYLQYLFAKYPVPSYLFQGLKFYWNKQISMRKWWIELIIKISQGESAIKMLQARLPELTKKDCQRFLSLENSSKKILSLPLDQKLRYCQIRNRGCSHEQACVLLGIIQGLNPIPISIDEIYIPEDPEDWGYDYFTDRRLTDQQLLEGHIRDLDQAEPYKLEFIQWVGQQSFIMPNTLQDMYDWYKTHKRENQNWTIIGQSANRVFSRTQDWERQQAREAAVARANHFSYSKTEVPEIMCTQFARPFEYADSMMVMSIQQIISRTELAREGDVMRHCVYSYRHSIYEGSVSIFSLRHGFTKEWTKSKPLVTIEVNRNKIVQARQTCNQYCTPNQQKVIEKWAKENNLSISPYVFDDFKYN